jgi:hypothetical protein
MLHAPMSDAKQAGNRATARAPQTEVEAYPRSLVAPGLGRLCSSAVQSRQQTATWQRVYGNQAVLRMLQRKLTIGSAHDPLEAEADAVAGDVMNSPPPSAVIRRKCACEDSGAPCENCQGKALQRRPANTATAVEAPPIVTAALRAPGQPLHTDVRGFMGTRFGADFSAVRVHTDSLAARSAHAVHADAYTVGREVVFASGKYAPHSAAGQRLLAHELTHVLQQGSATVQASLVQRQDDDTSGTGEPDKKKPGPGDPDVGEKGITVDSEGKICVDVGAGDPLCFSKDDFDKWWKRTCPPGRWRPVLGACCPEGTVADGVSCVKREEIKLPPITFPPVDPQPPPDTTPKVSPPTTPQVTVGAEILFTVDRPKPGDNSLGSTLFRGDRSAFDSLVKQLKADTTMKVQLVGRASPEGPGDAEQRAAYNQALGLRRAQLVKNELIKNGIGADRVADPPVQELRSECDLEGDGVITCGSAGSADPPDQADREVTARVFVP